MLRAQQVMGSVVAGSGPHRLARDGGALPATPCEKGPNGKRFASLPASHPKGTPMMNISHAHGQNPTNDPYLWFALAALALLCLTAKADAEHLAFAMQGAVAVLHAGHRLRP